jgi:ferredoxin
MLASLEMGTKGITIDSKTYETSLPGMFAGGDAVRRRRLAVRAVADGKEAEISIGQYLAGQQITGPAKRFNSHIGRIEDGEKERFLSLASKAGRVLPANDGTGFTAEQARAEAGRCLHCDCRKPQTCKLREYAERFGARASVYKNERRLFEAKYEHAEVVFEPGKCIDCGLCVQITEREKERLGLSFVGRGFDVRVAVPFGRSIADGLERTARACVEACPTGALAYRGGFGGSK